MNQLAGSYQLSHTWDQVISGSRAPSRCKQSTRCEQDIRRTSKRSHQVTLTVTFLSSLSLTDWFHGFTVEYSPPSPGSDSAPKSVVGVSHRVFHFRLKTHLFSRSFPPKPSSLSNGLISRFLSCTCTEVSGVENIGQCGRLSQLSWLLGAL